MSIELSIRKLWIITREIPLPATWTSLVKRQTICCQWYGEIILEPAFLLGMHNDAVIFCRHFGQSSRC